jgi:hypothetical protein
MLYMQVFYMEKLLVLDFLVNESNVVPFSLLNFLFYCVIIMTLLIYKLTALRMVIIENL